jgi:hypothetical protein
MNEHIVCEVKVMVHIASGRLASGSGAELGWTWDGARDSEMAKAGWLDASNM